MRATQLFLTITLIFAESGIASLAPNCIKAFNSISPRRFIEAVRHESCHSGCPPQSNLWDVLERDTMRKLVADGSSHLGINEGKEAMVEFLDTVFKDLRDKCGPDLEQAASCQDSIEAKNALKCAEDNSRTMKMHSLKWLLPYITAERCKKVGDYFESPELWEKSFPAQAQNYVNNCHEL